MRSLTIRHATGVENLDPETSGAHARSLADAIARMTGATVTIEHDGVEIDKRTCDQARAATRARRLTAEADGVALAKAADAHAWAACQARAAAA